jgi:hypothetical protein
MNSVVTVSDLLPADVLLYKGTSFVSRAIQFFDGTDHSHASLYLGDEQVGEAAARGLVRNSIHTSTHGNEWVDVYRLKDRPPDVSPVLEKATEYLDQGNRYGYEQLVLLAFLTLTRKLKATPTLRTIIRHTLDAAAAVLTRYLSQDREPMICSEFVYRAYDEALPEIDDPFSLRIRAFMRAFAQGPAAAPPGGEPRGLGVHPQSLLAFLSSESSSIWLEEPTGPGPREAPISFAAGESQIEALIETYLDEARSEPDMAARSMSEGASIEELAASTRQFAAALYEATHHEATMDLEPTVSFSSRSPMNLHLFQTAADFVTPADLYRTQSLFLVGRLDI